MRLFVRSCLGFMLFGMAWPATSAPQNDAPSVPVPMERTMAEVRAFLVERVPAFRAPDTAGAWANEAQRLRQRFLDEIVFEGVPESWRTSKPQVVWAEILDRGDYRIRKLRYEALPGLWIPALLYEPTGDVTHVPAILNVNGHDNLGKAHHDEQTRCINLARRGMLALHPEWLFFGELSDPEYNHGNLAYLDLVGVRGLSVFYLAMSRGIDVLAADPRTDPDRIAMTGLSGGGWQTAVLSALDERIDLIVPVAGHGALTPRIHNVSDIGDLEQAPSDMLTVGDYTHLTALFAPRPSLLIYNAKDQCCFLPEHTLPPLYDAVQPVYALLNAETMLETYINEDPGTHNYERDNRQQFYRFLNKHFLQPDERVDEEIPCADEMLTPEELKVGTPENNKTFVTLALAQFDALERPPHPAPGDRDFEAWQRTQRETLRDIAKPVAMTMQGRRWDQGDRDGGTWYSVQSEDWSVPARYWAPKDFEPGSLVILVADEGIGSVEDTVADLLAQMRHVLAVDPTFIGGNQAHENRTYALPMLINTTGERLLGVYAGQLLGICQWARETFSAKRISLHARGCMMGLASLTAAATTPGVVDELTLIEMPESLREIIASNTPYSKHPGVFCFGLAQRFDLDSLEALCHPARVVRR